jgi:DNA-binding transcriptional LysR family regulator
MSTHILRLDVSRSRGGDDARQSTRSEEAYAHALTLEQLRVLAAVAEAGSFSAAARALNKTQSNVSYHVACLEEQLDVVLFERSGRKPCLTPRGELLIEHAKQVLAALDDLRSVSFAFAGKLEPRISLALDHRFPPSRLAEVLARFRARFPEVAVCIEHTTESRDGGARAIDEAQIGVIFGARLDAGLVVSAPISVEVVPLVAPSHPLAGRVASDDDLCRYPELAHSPDGCDDRPRVTAWHVASEGLRLDLVRAGLGWARMPKHLVEDDLARGALVPLETTRWGATPVHVELYVARRRDRPMGPAGQWLFGALAQSA